MRTPAMFFVLSLAAASAAVAGPSKEIRDFIASCTNGLTCTAETFATGGDLYGFGVKRQAGPGTPVHLYFRAGAAFPAGSMVQLSVDGEPAGAFPADAFDRDEGDYANQIGDPAMVTEALAKLRNGKRLEVAHAGPAGRKTENFSLSGLAGSLTWLDEAQGRIGAKDAIVAKGDKDSPAPAVRDILSIDDLPAGMKDKFAENGECAFYDIGSFGRLGAFEDRLDGDAAMVVVPCGEGGAYNQPYRLFRVSDRGETPIALPAMGEEGPIVVEEAWNVDWDHATRTLTAFFKGRGVGDCGMYDKWRLIGEDEFRTFVLVESRQKDDCDGKGGIETFPIVWPIKRK